MQIIEKKEIWKSFCNIFEKCNQCEYKICVFASNSENGTLILCS